MKNLNIQFVDFITATVFAAGTIAAVTGGFVDKSLIDF